MWKANFTSLWSRKLRLAMSTIAIVLGVGFVSGSFVFSNMITGAFNGIVNATISDVEVGKDPTAALDDGSATTSAIDATLVEKIKQVEGVKDAAGTIGGPGVIVIGKDGKAITSFGPPQLGFNWHTLPALGQQPGPRLISGHEPQQDDQVVIDPDTLAKSGYALGDRVKLITPTEGTVEFTVVGSGTFGEGSTAGATYAFFTTARAQQLFLDGADAYGAVWVATEAGADRAAVAAQIQTLLPEGYRARDGQVAADEQTSALGQALGFIDIFLLVFAGIALLVASFLIINTFTILVAQRSKELALFRSMGASKAQILGTVVAEALVLGVVGSVVGLFTGILLALGIKEVMNLGGWDMGTTPITLDATNITVSLVTGIVVTVLASLSPALRATRIAPIEAMTAAQTEPDKGLGARAFVGTGLAVVGAALIVGALLLDLPTPLAWAGIGMTLATVGVAITSPLLGRPVVWLVGRAYRALFGEVGKLAELNSVRQPRRTAATASALMIGLALVSMIAILGQSANASIVDQVKNTVRGDYMIGQLGFTEFTGNVADQVAAVDAVDRVHRLKDGAFIEIPAGQDLPSPEVLADVSGRYQTWIGAMEPDSFDQVSAQTIVSGRMFSAPNEMIVDQDTAEKEGISVGSTQRYFSPEAQRAVTFTVVGIYDVGDGTVIYPKITSTASLQALGLAQGDVYLSIHLKPGADRAAARVALDAAVADLPLVSVMDTDEYTDQMLGNIAQVMALLYALLGLSIVIAVLGIVNTLGLSIVERTREIGLLRAIALTRAQVRRMISLESVVIALLGAVVGVGLGTAFGVVLQKVLPADQGINLLSIPWEQLAGFLVAAGLVGVLAAVWPAHRAARTDVLAAIAAE